MKKNIFIILLLLSFLLIKAINNGVRLSDTNIYFNIAYQIFQGKVLYKDIFFSNFPLFSYISSFYYFLSGKNINIFYFTSIIEVSLTSFFIYLTTYRQTKNYIVSITTIILYLFSSMILYTSDHQTGVFVASLFSVLGYFFFQEKKIVLSGVFISAAVFSKAYFAPILISFIIYFLIKKEWKLLLKFGASFSIAGLAILLPSLIQAPRQLISDIFGFSLTRPAGTIKTDVMWFFINRDILLFILLIFNLINMKKNIFFGLISIFSIIFFFGYQDVYYLYLNFLTPFLCLSLYEIYLFLESKFHIQKLVIPTIIITFSLLNLTTYLTTYKSLGKFENFNEIKNMIISQSPTYIYGASDIAPLLIALTNIPGLENIDTPHEYFFDKNIYNKDLLTHKAVKSRTIIITHGAYYPDYNIRQDVLDNIFIKEAIYKNCKNILSAPVLSEGNTNRINLFKCY